MFGPKGPFCQSCGMPLSKDEKGGGTNPGGSLSTEYCSKCYADGEFLWKDATAEKMQTLVADKLKGMGFPRFMARWFTKDIPNLRRWKK